MVKAMMATRNLYLVSHQTVEEDAVAKLTKESIRSTLGIKDYLVRKNDF